MTQPVARRTVVGSPYAGGKNNRKKGGREKAVRYGRIGRPLLIC